jgi:hypothetical protein
MPPFGSLTDKYKYFGGTEAKRQHMPPKREYPSTRLQGAIIHRPQYEFPSLIFLKMTRRWNLDWNKGWK